MGTKLIQKVYEAKKEHSNNERYWLHPILLDTSYLRYPQHQTIKILPLEFSTKILNQSNTILEFPVQRLFIHIVKIVPILVRHHPMLIHRKDFILTH